MGPLDEAVSQPLTLPNTGEDRRKGIYCGGCCRYRQETGELSKGLNYQEAALVVTWIVCSRRGFVCFLFFFPHFSNQERPPWKAAESHETPARLNPSVQALRLITGRGKSSEHVSSIINGDKMILVMA